MKKGLIYSRVSTEDQAKEGQSIEAQLRMCTFYAKENSIQVVEVFKDEGKSGSNTNRPGLKAMLERASTDQEIECVLVMDTDRIARNTYDHLGIKALLKKHSVKLISISQPMIDDSPEGNFIDTVLASANALQSQITGRKTSKVMEQKIKAGWWAGVAPLGYINADNSHPTSSLDRRIITPDPARASVITQIYKLYATGTYTIETITQKAESLGLTPKFGQKLHKSIVHKALSNPIYYGVLPWKAIIYPGKHEPLIDQETWEMCQDVLGNHNQHASRTRKHDYVLRGFVYCGICGNRFWAEQHQRRSLLIEHYYCKQCRKGTYTDTHDLEKQVIALFGKVKMTKEYAEGLVTEAKQVLEELISTTKEDKQILVNRRTALQEQLATADMKLVSGTLTDERYKAISSKLENDIALIEEDITKIHKDYHKKFEGIKNLAEMARDIKVTYKKADPQLKRYYLELFFDKILVKEGKIIAAIPSKDIQPLIKDGRISVLVRTNWLPG